MKTAPTLLLGAILGVAAIQIPHLLAVSYPPGATAKPAAASASASASATAQPQGTGTRIHPISTNITDRLTKSTRHMDTVNIKQGDREIVTQIYYPTDRNKAMAVVLIHEIFGLSDWMKAAADQLAENGYIVVVPDLVSGTGPNKGGTNDVADLTAVEAYAKNLDACDGNVVVAGFCWGGGKAFAFSTVNKDIKAALVFYGAPMLAAAEMPKINCPIYGFYGGTDRSLASAVPGEQEAMKAAGKFYDAVVYDGAQHGYMRTGQMDNTNAADKKAAEESWKRMLEILKKIDSPPAAATPAAANGTAK